jgi:hypothetical protein
MPEAETADAPTSANIAAEIAIVCFDFKNKLFRELLSVFILFSIVSI